MTTIHDLLRQYWGSSSFLPLQEEIIISVLSGNDTLAIMATGGGKSLCYQLPALYLGGLTLVISPLISLMKDQVDDLQARGIPAAAWNSSLDLKERSQITQGISDGSLRLLFISPEKCMQPGFLSSIASARVRLIAIDEAHCISEWGHNFRPEYRQLARIKEVFPGIPLIALTATAVPGVRRDIRQQLKMGNGREFTGSFNRKNLRYCVVPKKNPLVFLADYIGQHRGESGIVYCLSREETEMVAGDLQRRGFSAAAYHAGLPRQERERVQESFIRDRVQVVCATVAFGMGIDKPDVRFVIHYVLPKTLEGYYQETGRAGRDGQYSECVLLYSRGDYARIRSMIEHNDDSGQHLRISLTKLQDMAEYCETTGCRRKFLLTYFGEEYPQENCGSCDTCDHPPEMTDCTDAAKLIAGCVTQLPRSFGIDLIADVLRGSKSEKARQYNLTTLPAYGTGKKYSKAQYRTWIQEMIRQGFLCREGDQYPVIRCTSRADEILKNRCRVMLPVPENGPGRRSTPAPVLPVSGSEELFQRLKALRREIAEENRVPPYVIFPDRTLQELASRRPSGMEDLSTVFGIGAVKREKYGKAFLREIAHYEGYPAVEEGHICFGHS
ncbi:DNA helicase RecQ [Methanoregula sp.]|uniref:DNA helicase RecQ n=1 Tax=Methanoregula sp. TaxID=2052170 RepID=UPI00261A42B6|nr:DNA helicase RecQ [Methanoregula sp.]MDD5142330.1 DNA helicase RecQ [Methanoregula sp.]